MDAAELQAQFDRYSAGTTLMRIDVEPCWNLGLVADWRALRAARHRQGAVWAMGRDIYWVGAPQATHIFLVVRTEFEPLSGELLLWTDEGEMYSVEPIEPDSPNGQIMAEFRRNAALPGSGYANADEIQRPAVERYLEDCEKEAAP